MQLDVQHNPETGLGDAQTCRFTPLEAMYRPSNYWPSGNPASTYRQTIIGFFTSVVPADVEGREHWHP